VVVAILDEVDRVEQIADGGAVGGNMQDCSRVGLWLGGRRWASQFLVKPVKPQISTAPGAGSSCRQNDASSMEVNPALPVSGGLAIV
jgi:hypothetical protein